MSTGRVTLLIIFASTVPDTGWVGGKFKTDTGNVTLLVISTGRVAEDAIATGSVTDAVISTGRVAEDAIATGKVTLLIIFASTVPEIGPKFAFKFNCKSSTEPVPFPGARHTNLRPISGKD